MDASLSAYPQRHRVRGVGFDNEDVRSANFSRNLGFGSCLVADEAKDCVGRVFRELADKLKLEGKRQVSHVVTCNWLETVLRRTPRPREMPVITQDDIVTASIVFSGRETMQHGFYILQSQNGHNASIYA